MKSYHMTLGAGLQGLVLREHEVPQPGPGEVLLKVHAVSLNFRELMILQQGRYPLPVKPDVIGLCDGAAEVVQLGAGAHRFALSDRVVASIFPHWQAGPFTAQRAAQLGGSLDGMLTEYAVLPQDALVPVPDHLSWEEAACLPCAGVTAWNALTGGLPLQAGQDVLVLGSGGVSPFALQVAKAFGARVIATSSGEAKARQLRKLGADAVIDRGVVPDWSAEVKRLTGGTGVQHVVEVGGGATLPQSLQSVALGGEIAFVGTAAGGSSLIDANAVFASGAVLRPVAAGSREQLAAFARTMAVNTLRPVIARVFDFEDAPAALAWYAQGQAVGKTVIRVAS
ncbi:zinc-dependent alcohol dehydrogenase family protein [Ideonella sp. BN130291]|uniref:zinc-dependent alcohol dehydrogenase family protein n=1 Tax=Ideonella sp. BN130291 TaxID=3112940 RepID=UPI002E25D0E9|nr:NAD(P)-dependent alcohol dehydrogenase [Ideonella sp. BN130291]